MRVHDFGDRPWSMVAADLCNNEGQILLVVSDYYSNYIDVSHLTSATSRTVETENKQEFRIMRRFFSVLIEN